MCPNKTMALDNSQPWVLKPLAEQSTENLVNGSIRLSPPSFPINPIIIQTGAVRNDCLMPLSSRKYTAPSIKFAFKEKKKKPKS